MFSSFKQYFVGGEDCKPILRKMKLNICNWIFCDYIFLLLFHFFLYSKYWSVVPDRGPRKPFTPVIMVRTKRNSPKVADRTWSVWKPSSFNSLYVKKKKSCKQPPNDRLRNISAPLRSNDSTHSPTTGLPHGSPHPPALYGPLLLTVLQGCVSRRWRHWDEVQ